MLKHFFLFFLTATVASTSTAQGVPRYLEGAYGCGFGSSETLTFCEWASGIDGVASGELVAVTHSPVECSGEAHLAIDLRIRTADHAYVSVRIDSQQTAMWVERPYLDGHLLKWTNMQEGQSPFKLGSQYEIPFYQREETLYSFGGPIFHKVNGRFVMSAPNYAYRQSVEKAISEDSLTSLANLKADCESSEKRYVPRAVHQIEEALSSFCFDDIILGCRSSSDCEADRQCVDSNCVIDETGQTPLPGDQQQGGTPKPEAE